MHLSERERITILMMRGFGDNVKSYEVVTVLFNLLLTVGLSGGAVSLVRQGSTWTARFLYPSVSEK